MTSITASCSEFNPILSKALRKLINEGLHPETVNESNQHTRVGQLGQPLADRVAALVESIGAIGLQTPPTVRAGGGDDGAYLLVVGAHRLEALRRLGVESADFVVLPHDANPELWEIDEYLCRSELTASERATLTARRKQIYEEMHPETRHGGDRRSSRQHGDLKAADRFTEETAKVSGRSERKVQRDAERGAKVSAEAMKLVAGTALDTSTLALVLRP